ncbi:alpha/beta fold hydrolase [Synechococcales cyanobacterium C]|uniref:Alpha/beta fold hydrolase n=1 Tax=Petrachloros mirabilis ULC683 TaxID=2781853 RepID=A0A8K2A6G9_9CYAN|nr:alpha/beta fold hydrolase [Petrachloros mirabilis ULC683]
MGLSLTLETQPPQLYWQWRDWKIHYVQQGNSGPCLLLIHGFGASTDHWRQNLVALSQHYRVWAIDLLGFGRSQKPAVNYTGELWRDQLQDFCREVIKSPVYVAGNSLGGYAALCLAVDCPEWVEGVILLNCAGPFSEDERPTGRRQSGSALMGRFLKLPGATEVLSWFLFQNMRRRSQIRKVLLRVYKDPNAVTERLIEDIRRPAFDPGALGVFSAVFKSPPGRKLDQLLEGLHQPLLLLWGVADPWMSVDKANKFCQYYPSATLKLLDAGHCPHDECPEVVNATIQDWVDAVDAVKS